MLPSISVLALPVQAAQPLTAERFVSVTGEVPASGARCYGVARSSVPAGAMVTVDVMGTCTVETGAPIPANSAIQTDALGRAIPLAAGQRLGCMAPRQAEATAAGQFVEVLVSPN